jgi:arylsulfatase A-like enzyme
MLKRIAWIVSGLLVLGVGTFYAVGGYAGSLLLFVRYAVRTEAAPYREVSWKAGPEALAAKAEKSEKTGRRKQPNVILIMADDLGFNDITLNGGGLAGGSVPTPHIDSIARQGVNFQTGYAGNATCAPSRAALMTGRYPTRFGFEFTPTPKQFMKVIGNEDRAGSLFKPVYYPERAADLIPYEDMGLPTSEITVARLLKESGYHTVHLGKWHLGDSPKFRPYSHGFNESLSMQHGASMFLPENAPNVVNAKQAFDPIDRFLWASHSWGIRFNDGPVFQPPRYMTDYLTDEAIKVVAANKHQPFFMYLAYNAPHTPLQSTREDYDALAHIADHTTRVYAAMIRSLDRNIGRVLQSLKDQGLDDDTLVIFTSDNGGAHYLGIDGLNSPYRGWKATFYEGGTRVPFFMRWPGGLPAGVRYAAPVSHFDIFASTVAVAGAKSPSDRPIDGVNLLPFVRGEVTGQPHQQLFWRTSSYRAVRAGDWKLQVMEKPKQDLLYNLAQDPTERKNLAAQEAPRVAEMKALLAGFEKTQIKPMWPSLAEGAIPIDKTMKQPQAAGDAHVYYAN